MIFLRNGGKITSMAVITLKTFMSVNHLEFKVCVTIEIKLAKSNTAHQRKNRYIHVISN